MMIFRRVLVIFSLVPISLFAQSDSIKIWATLDQSLRELHVKQKIHFTNPSDSTMTRLRLLNWVAAYRNEGTALAKRKIEDRKSELHFARKSDLGYLRSLTISGSSPSLNYDHETLSIPLSTPLEPGESGTMELEYDITLPSSTYTGYGKGEEKALLKYFFLIPDGFPEVDEKDRVFNDTEETGHGGLHYQISFLAPEDYLLESNLPLVGNEFTGSISTDPEILVTKQKPETYSVVNDWGKTTIVLETPVKEEEHSRLEIFFPLQLDFLFRKTGSIPEKIFISNKFKDKEDFFGNDDIKFWKFKFQLFTDPEKTDLDYFSLISKKVAQESAITYKSKDHWFTNGLKTYLEIQYLSTFYNDAMLLGKLPEEAKILGIRPLKYLTAAKLRLLERYGIAYQYIMTQNLDQKIGEPFAVLSNFNEMAISQFETGSLLNYISDKMSEKEFESFLKDYLLKNEGKPIDSEEFLDQLSIRSEYSSEFLKSYIHDGGRINFKVKRFEKIPEGYLVSIAKNSPYSIPIKVTSEEIGGDKTSHWYDTSKGTGTSQYLIPRENIHRISVNDEYIFPENNLRDNYLYTKGLFSNTKKIKLKLLKDIPDPEYNEIYLMPKLTFNAYDKVLIGLNFKNKSLFDQQFQYSLTPYYSTGSGKPTGAGVVSYTFAPQNSFFRTLQVGAEASYFHYNYDLTYKRFSVFSSLNFAKVLRSSIARTLYFSFQHVDRQLSEEMIEANEYGKYGLWNFGYTYRDTKMINEWSFGANLQMMNDFQKISTEAFYRYEYAKNKKISFRWFGGYFLTNETRNNLFDFGVSRVSNYAFSYSLLGQSATEGVLSQQYVAAEGGFKSNVASSVNGLLTTVGVDAHVWKMFNLYADAGLYKNRKEPVNFIWDSGVKLRLIPDFLEIYFPIQSSLGFEPSLENYGKRIRFTLNLNFGALTAHFRRGWY